MHDLHDAHRDTGLAGKGLSALRWNAIGAGVRAVSQLGVTSLLARKLGPAPFGVVAAALIVISLANLYADGGIGAAIVQRADCDESVLQSAFTLQMLIGIAGSLLITLVASPAGKLFGQPDLPKVLRVLSLFFIIQAFGDTAECVLRRRLEFRRLQLASVTSYLAGYGGFGLVLAFRGFGVWSLVFAQLIQASLYSLVIYGMVRHSIRPSLRSVASLFRFGAAVMSVNTANWVLSNADNLVAGRWFGTVSLGLYSRAFNLVYAPIQNVVVTVQQVLFPVYSRASSEGDGIRRAYLSSVNGVSLCLIPTFFTTACAARTIVLGLYGPEWMGAAAVLVPLSLSMPFYAVMGLAGPVLWGRGEAFREFRVQAILAGAFGVVLMVAGRGSLVGLAWTVFAINVLRAVLMTRAATSILVIEWRTIGRCIKGPLILGFVTGLIVGSLDHALIALSVLPQLRLIALVLAGAASVSLGLLEWSTLFIIRESFPHVRRIPWMAKRLDERSLNTT